MDESKRKIISDPEVRFWEAVNEGAAVTAQRFDVID